MARQEKPALDRAQLAGRLSHKPERSEADRQLPYEERLEKVDALSDFLEPTRFQLTFAAALHRLMKQREAYAMGEVFNSNAVEICAEQIPGKRSFLAHLPASSNARPAARGSTLLAMPGLGKTVIAKRVLDLFDRKVARNINGTPQLPRVPSLYLHASPSSLHSFCAQFLQALAEKTDDPRINTVFLAQNASKELMPSALVDLAKAHSLGVLVVDDIQSLLTTDNRAVAKIMKLLKRLQQEAGVPVVLLGTLAGGECFKDETEAALAFDGPASDVWDRLPYDREWDRFVEALWQNQWTSTPTPLSEELSLRLYDHSQGVLSLAVNLYQRVQVQLIRRGQLESDSAASGGHSDELITADFIDAVAEWCFKPIHPHLDALRSRDFAKLAAFPDMTPLPSEARRMELQRKEAEQAAAQGDAEPRLSAEEMDELDLIDASPEELDEVVRKNTEVAETLLAAARSSMSAAEIAAQKQVEILKKVSKDLDEKIHANPRKFLTEVERRIRIEENLRNKQKKREPRKATEEDLESILRPGSDVIKEIKAAGLGLGALLARP